MEIKEIIEKYEIKKVGSDKISCCKKALSDGMIDTIKARKSDIIAYIDAKEAEEKAAFEDRQRKISEIEGLAEINKAIYELEKWHYEFRNSFDGESGGGVGVGKKPEYDFEAMYRRYPRAAAYLKADKMALSENYSKSKFGREAREKIINGEDYEQALKEADEKWNAYCEKHMWD